MFSNTQAVAEFLQRNSETPCPLEMQMDVLQEVRRRLSAETALLKALPAIKIMDMLTQIEGTFIQGQGFQISYGTLIDGPWKQLVAVEVVGSGATFPEAEEQTIAAFCSQFKKAVQAKLQPPKKA